MSPEQLSKIKEYQHDFQNRFGKKLEIDWPMMKGLVIADRLGRGEGPTYVNYEQLLEDCVAKHKADIKLIKNRKKRLQVGELAKERDAVIEYSRLVLKNRLNVRLAAKLINRDRTSIYHFGSNYGKM
jgi:hypothetical protein